MSVHQIYERKSKKLRKNRNINLRKHTILIHRKIEELHVVSRGKILLIKKHALHFQFHSIVYIKTHVI